MADGSPITSPRGLFVCGFAGFGGSCEGVRRATGRSPDYAINHWDVAMAAHAANHPETIHLPANIWDVRPADLTKGRPVWGAWFSPDCRHFSRAKGGKPAHPKVRALAWVVHRWAREVRPSVIFMENVPEWLTWGTLDDDGKPIPSKVGNTFRIWLGKLKALGYHVEWRVLRACDYGAPTTRKRLFLIARCDGQPIVWPEPTHGPGRIPFRTAAECIDWSIPCQSIFDRKKPLVDATLRRVARGVRKFVLEAAEPFVVSMYGTTTGGRSLDEPLPTTTAQSRHEYLVVPSLIHCGNGERDGQDPRVYDIEKPLSTVVAGGRKHALVCAFLAKHYGGHETPGQQLSLPMSTVTTQDHHGLVEVHAGGRPDRREQVRAFLTQYNGQSIGQSLQLPLGTVVTHDRFGLVTVCGQDHEITDICMRMLHPHELGRANGLRPGYKLDVVFNGRPISASTQVRLIGNMVCPDVAEQLVRANAPASALQEAA